MDNAVRQFASPQRDVAEIVLKPYATHWQQSKGRLHDEPSAHDRTPFQRDRDRIIHSDAFRRLQYKTQVFQNQTAGDHYRTRLTHTLEVAQLARTICRSLGLDDDLGETIALAHDLGHPPFGHAGEDALNACMENYGGFYHNDQTLRVVRQLECRYAAFDGLNLTWESLEGIAKHNGPIETGTYPEELYGDLEPQGWCGLEGQVAALADDLAYNHHDLDDGITMGSLRVDDARELTSFNTIWEEIAKEYPSIDRTRHVRETIRRMIGRQVKDLLDTTHANLGKVAPKSAEEVRSLDMPLVAFSSHMQEEMKVLKAMLFERSYRHYEVNRAAYRAHRVMTDLFDAFMNHRRMLPTGVQQQLPEDKSDDHSKAVIVVNYLASMTDRSAMAEHKSLFGSVDQLL